MCACFYYALIKCVNLYRYLRSGTRCHLYDVTDPVFLITRIDTLRAIAGIKIRVKLQARYLLKHRHADLFGCSRIHSRFVNNHRVVLHYAANSLARQNQRGQIWLFILVDWSGHGNNEYTAVGQIFFVMCKRQLAGLLQLLL